MAEYIEREAVRDALYEADAITMRGVAIINQFPAADVRPVVRGKWTNTADALDSSATDYSGNHLVYLVDIDDAPTIIPAEEGE